jgi:hypothetical protein
VLHALARQGHAEALRQAVFDADPTIQVTAFERPGAEDHRRALAVFGERRGRHAMLLSPFLEVTSQGRARRSAYEEVHPIYADESG